MHVVNAWIGRTALPTYFWTEWSARSPLEKRVITAVSVFFGCLCLYWVYKGVTGSEETEDKADDSSSKSVHLKDQSTSESSSSGEDFSSSSPPNVNSTGPIGQFFHSSIEDRKGILEQFSSTVTNLEGLRQDLRNAAKPPPPPKTSASSESQ